MFFDESEYDLPKDAQYYFNILVICVAVSPRYAQNIFDKDIIDIWDIQQITNPRPNVVHVFVDKHIDEDIDFLIECFPHSVVEIDQQKIGFYDMIDFDTNDPWRIDPYELD